MNSTIYYFSSTGNTLHLARGLAAALGEEPAQPMAALVKAGERVRLEPDRAVVLAFPLYYLSMPALVRRFLALLEGHAEVHAVVTRGMAGMGGLWPELRALLRAQGQTLRSGRYVEAPNNDILLFNACPEAQLARKLLRLEASIPRLAARLRKGKPGFSPEPFGFLAPWRREVYARRIERASASFHAEAGCTGCGLCARFCPQGTISLREGRPQWSTDCQECQGCLHLCPTRALQFDTITQTKRRYRHPLVGTGELCAQKRPE